MWLQLERRAKASAENDGVGDIWSYIDARFPEG
jgi:hypothetical protein